MANKTFIGEEIFEFKPMGIAAPPMADPDPSPAPLDPGPGGAPEQAEGEDSTPEKSNTLTYLAIGLLALYFLRRK